MAILLKELIVETAQDTKCYLCGCDAEVGYTRDPIAPGNPVLTLCEECADAIWWYRK